jgi:hypothetical protein
MSMTLLSASAIIPGMASLVGECLQWFDDRRMKDSCVLFGEECSDSQYKQGLLLIFRI